MTTTNNHATHASSDHRVSHALATPSSRTSHSSRSRSRSRTRSSSSGSSSGTTLAHSLTAIGDVVRVEMRRELDHLRGRAGEYLEQGKRRALDMKDGVAGTIRERPLTSVLVAAGVGLAIGLMLPRRR